MAPELVEGKLDEFKGRKILLDPMMGSGSFVISAARRGHHAVGIDSDPLAHVITSAAIGGHDHGAAIDFAESAVRRAYLKSSRGVRHDDETQKFIEFWFDPVTEASLGKLAAAISDAPESLKSVLWCAFSRLIITKDAGVSRARDVSHSRPHRVRETASFDPLDRFVGSVQTVLKRSGQVSPRGKVSLIRGDVRAIPLPNASVNGIMTSPPYLIAIDYLRGHRLSLVWMGYSLSELRSLRSENIGSHRGDSLSPELAHVLKASVQGELPDQKKRVLNRYIGDLDKTVSELARVLRRRGSVTFVVANARHSASAVSVEKITSLLSERNGLVLCDRTERALPANHRYMPPPREGAGGMNQRMHTEVILTFSKK